MRPLRKMEFQKESHQPQYLNERIKNKHKSYTLLDFCRKMKSEKNEKLQNKKLKSGKQKAHISQQMILIFQCWYILY